MQLSRHPEPICDDIGARRAPDEHRGYGHVNARPSRGESATEVAASVAHDFNNVLTVISGNLALAERHAAGNPKLIRLLNNIRLAAERASDLTGELMHFAIAVPIEPTAEPEGAVERPAKILVVEDDPDVAEVAVAVLESMGHDVRMCPNATAALTLLEENAGYDLVFSDIMMPGPLNGIDLAETILKKFPDLPVLLATGFSNAALAPGALRFPVLAKPYSVQELTRRVGQMIQADH
jgi:CheY-like chemotaxis protein